MGKPESDSPPGGGSSGIAVASAYAGGQLSYGYKIEYATAAAVVGKAETAAEPFEKLDEGIGSVLDTLVGTLPEGFGGAKGKLESVKSANVPVLTTVVGYVDGTIKSATTCLAAYEHASIEQVMEAEAARAKIAGFEGSGLFGEPVKVKKGESSTVYSGQTGEVSGSSSVSTSGPNSVKHTTTVSSEHTAASGGTTVTEKASVTSTNRATVEPGFASQSSTTTSTNSYTSTNSRSTYSHEATTTRSGGYAVTPHVGVVYTNNQSTVSTSITPNGRTAP